MRRYPLQLSYIAKTALWAGDRLKTEFGKVSDYETISETWELSVRPNEMSMICNGEAKGMCLSDYISLVGYDCVSPLFGAEDRFPLLVKFIDARDVLSVQVHPDDAYAFGVEGDSGKTEMWYVVDAAEGATLVYGLKKGVTKEAFACAVREERIGDVMNHVPVKAGEIYFIPAGMLHAIGAGILVAEIQQNSDLTYRVYDFDRVGADGKKRELHVQRALDVTRPFTEEEIKALRYTTGYAGEYGELLADSQYFRVQKMVCSTDRSRKLTVSKDGFVSALCVEGSGQISHENQVYFVQKGDSYFLPAGMGTCECSGDMTLLLSETK